jgi:transposase
MMDDIIPAPTLDTRTGASLEPSRRAEVFTGTVGRRRSWSFEQKLAIVVEAEKSDNLSELARRHDIRTSQLYTWRRELRYALHAKGPALAIEQEPMFVPIVEDTDGLATRAPINGMAIEVEMSAGVLRISQNADIALVQAVIDALRAVR